MSIEDELNKRKEAAEMGEKTEQQEYGAPTSDEELEKVSGGNYPLDAYPCFYNQCAPMVDCRDCKYTMMACTNRYKEVIWPYIVF